jgi:hypothetical protein
MTTMSTTSIFQNRKEQLKKEDQGQQMNLAAKIL